MQHLCLLWSSSRSTSSLGLQINTWYVDLFNAGVGKGLDLVGSFHGRAMQGVTGRLWVEVKVFSYTGFSGKVKIEKAKVVQLLPKVQQKDQSIQAVMLYAARVEKTDGDWGKPLADVWLYTQGSWIDLSPSGGRVPTRGKVKATAKPSLTEVWAFMGCFVKYNDTDPAAGQLGHFLQAFGLPAGSCGKRAASFLNKLTKHDFPGRLWQEDLGNVVSGHGLLKRRLSRCCTLSVCNCSKTSCPQEQKETCYCQPCSLKCLDVGAGARLQTWAPPDTCSCTT
jgi:hypothetical protein